MKKLKNIDFKGLFINHGEKMGMALIAFIVVAVLGSELTSGAWKTSDKVKGSPADLDKQIKDAKARIEAPTNTWPLAKSEQYAIVDFNGQARDVFTGMNTAKYEFTTPMFWPLYRKKEKAREPDLSAPIYLIAEAGLASLGTTAKMSFGEPSEPTQPEAMPSETESTLKPQAGATTGPGPGFGPAGAPASGFGIPTATPVRPGGAGPSSGPGAPRSGGARPATPARPPGAPGPGAHGGGAHGAGMPGMAGMMGMPEMGGSMGMAGGMTAKGKRFVAVRAIVPIKEQIERAMKALNMSYADASAAIEYTDFTLERQTAQPGPDPWTGEWEVVDKKYALEVLETSADFDPDPVPADLQDAVFTMPLPFRLLRYWGDLATHPNIKNFQLSEAEMQREKMMYDKLVEEAEKLQIQSEPKVKKKGLTPAVNDLRGMAQSVFSTTSGSKEMTEFMRQNSNGQNIAGTDLKNRMSASGRLYLFRYFDFDVQPGMAYRYRLKLELRNPNFERPYEEVEDQAVTKGPYRETGWSNISNPTVVPETTKYYLKNVERDPVRDDKYNRKPVANVAMYEWDANFGTMLADTLRILNVGQFIAEKKKSWVLDPGTPTYEEKEVAFATDDMLVDASGDLELLPELHPDLQLKPEKGRKDVQVGMLADALVVTGNGELKTLDSMSDVREERSMKQSVEEERKNFQYLKDAPAETRGALDGPGFPGGMPAGMPMSGPGGRPGGRQNARKKGGSGMMTPEGPAGGHGSGPGGDSGSGSRSGPRRPGGIGR
ncbi:MAG: hypothetical protein E6Q76_04660 [Rhizobium sp.]|nr:MAG: hypothetical protein E6Q76_04660 [Rhizobium sp.]